MAERIAIFLPNWIGDVVMATPLLRALRRQLGTNVELIGVMKPYVADVLQGTSWLNERVSYDPRNGDRALGGWALVKRLRSLNIDSALLLTNSLRTAALAWMSGAKRRVGYARDWRGWLLTERFQPPRAEGQWQPISAVDYYLRLGTAWGCGIEDQRLELVCTPQDAALAEQVWQRLALPRAGRVVALHAAGGGNGTATAKAWPVEHFGALARELATQHNAEVLVLCGPNERDTAREIVRLANNARVKSLAGESPSISLTKGCLNRCDLLVSTDSGPRHIATALNVPTIGLFGATDPRWAETFHARGMIIFNRLECGPCGEKHCPLGHHHCMRELSVERVLFAVQQQLAQDRRKLSVSA